MNVLACAVGFGLGPSGKLCSIVNNNAQFDWYACGDKLDLSIYKNNPYKDTCWSKDEETLKEFIKKYDIKCVVNVLDPDLAIFFKEIGLKVIYVDSLPFMWTKADIIPYDVDYYCAQKYPNFSMNTVLEKVKNFVWVEPITVDKIKNQSQGGIVINFGGLHSPFGEGTEYFEIIMNAILPFIHNKEIIITGGENVVRLANKLFPEISCKTYSHEDFLELVSGSETFITSPGLTTIYETSNMDIKTIILPPQNLSQFYNTTIAEKVCKNVKVLSWNHNCLSFEYLQKFNDKPEEETVKYIYEQISKFSTDSEYLEKFKQCVEKTLKEEFKKNKAEYFEGSGVAKISEILCKIKEEI